MKIIKTTEEDFKTEIKKIITRNMDFQSEVERVTNKIIEAVKENKDKSLFEFIEKYEKWKPRTKDDILVSDSELKEQIKRVPEKDKRVIQYVANRIKWFHRKTFPGNIILRKDGEMLGKVVVPIDSVGIYSPGGKAAYPSTVLMCAIPAYIAKVNNIYLATPAQNGQINPYIAYAAYVSGVKRIFKVGGAHAISAFAFGTETIPKVDKIVGPGNIYVATAKRKVQGIVGTDIIAGPSEIVVVSDGSGNPNQIAIDLIAQAEHDERAMSIFICNVESFCIKVKNCILKFVDVMSRRDIIRVSLKNNGAIILTRDVDESLNIANKIAPEHLEIVAKNPKSLLKKVKNAGTIFLSIPQAIGDYIAGPSHVLPTYGTARFSSGLSVDDFVKKTNIIFFTKRRLIKLAKYATRFANIEGLQAHALSMERRFTREKFL